VAIRTANPSELAPDSPSEEQLIFNWQNFDQYTAAATDPHDLTLRPVSML